MPQATFTWKDKLTGDPIAGVCVLEVHSERKGNWWQASDDTALSVVKPRFITVPDSGTVTVEVPESEHDEYYVTRMRDHRDSEHKFTAPSTDFDVFDPNNAYDTPAAVINPNHA